MQWRIWINAPEASPKTSIRPRFSLSPKASIKKKGLILLFHVNGPLLYRMVFRAIHHVEKDQPPMHRTGYLEREVLLRMPRTAVRNAMTGSTRKRIGLCVPGPSGVHMLAEFPVPPAPMLRGSNLLLRSTSPEIQGSTRAPVLRRGGRTARGLARGVSRSNLQGSCKYIGPFPSAE